MISRDKHRIATRFFLSRTVDFNSARHNIMGKEAKGKAKGKIRAAKRVKGEKCSAEDQEVKESTDSLRYTLIAEMSSLG